MSGNNPGPRGPILELVCPPQTDMLALIRRVIVATAHEVGFSPEEVHSIEMSVDEACANVIRHAYRDRDENDEANIHVQIRAASDHLSIRIVDTGSGLPADGARGVSSVEEYALREKPNGLGTFIIGQFMDEVAYDTPADSGTVLSMVKYLRRTNSG